MPDRIQKILAAAGIASRRKAEEIIAAGRVTLNGAVVTEQGTKADAPLVCAVYDRPGSSQPTAEERKTWTKPRRWRWLRRKRNFFC